MAEFAFEAIYDGPARAYYDSLPPTDQAEIAGIRETIEADPSPDGATKFVHEVPPDIVLTAYIGARWRLLYYIPEPGENVIDAIEPASSAPWWAGS